MFEKKTWVNRQSEHPARRRLTPTGNDNEYDVARAEGVIMEDGDAFDAETMNDLEKRVAEGFSTLDPADLGADVCVQVYACVKSGTVYELTGSGAVGRCKIPAAWNSGDTWSVNGKAVPAYCGADAVDSDCIVAGRWVLFTFDGQRLDFNGGGGLSSGKLAQATAAESDVLSGKKFFAGNKTLKTGTLALSGNANAAQVLSGYTFYKDNAKSKQTGTMANKGAVSASVDPGSTYTIPAGYHDGNGHVSGNRKYNTVYLGQQDSPWAGFSYNVKANYPSIYNKLSRNNFIAIPHKYDGSCGDGSYRNTGNCGDFISYDASTGVVTMNGFGVGTQDQIRMTVMFKLYMIY